MTTIKFGTDGWRGVIAEDYTFENVRKVAHAIARYIVRAANPGQAVVVGYDTRFGSENFARAVDSFSILEPTNLPRPTRRGCHPSGSISS